MTLRTQLGLALGFLLTALLLSWQDTSPTAGPFWDVQNGQMVRNRFCTDGNLSDCVHGLQCYGCNIIQERRYVDVGCSNPEVITCSHSHKGFKHRFCLKTESMALGMVLTSGCATSRHCQQRELPGVRIHCCDTDLCNSAPRRCPGVLHCLGLLGALLLAWLWG